MEAQADLEQPLLGHRQALLRAIAQLPSLTQQAEGGSSLSPPRQHAASSATQR